MREYSREENMALCNKFNQYRKEGKDNFDGFSKEDKLALALWQIEVLNRDSKNEKVWRAWDKWNKLAKILIVELLQESVEVPTNKGMRKILNIDGNIATICRNCNGTTINYQRKNNHCCVRGWYYTNNIKPISEDKYKIKAINKYLKDLQKKRMLSKYTKEEMLEMSFEEVLNYTKMYSL